MPPGAYEINFYDSHGDGLSDWVRGGGHFRLEGERSKPIIQKGIGDFDYQVSANFIVHKSAFSESITYDCSDIGTHPVVLMTRDNYENGSRCETTVTIVDQVAPVMSACPDDITVSTDEGNCGALIPKLPLLKYDDNCGSASLSYTYEGTPIDPYPAYTGEGTGLLSELFVYVGSAIVNYTVEDPSGNKTDCSFSINVVDENAPSADCKYLTVRLDQNGQTIVNASNLVSSSSNECDIAEIIASKTSFDCSDVGENTLTVSVIDHSGNSSQCQATVNLIDERDPIAICQDRTVQLNGDGQIVLNPADFDGGSTDNCGIASFFLDKTNFNCNDLGSHTIQLIVEDVNRNSSSCMANVYIEEGTGLPSEFASSSIGTSIGSATYEACTGQNLHLKSTQTSSYDYQEGWGQMAYVNLKDDCSFSAELLSKSSNAVAGVMVRSSNSDGAMMGFVGMHGYTMTGGVNHNGNGHVMKTGKGRASRKVVFSVTRSGDVITFKQGRTILLKVNVAMGSSIMVGVFLSSDNTSEASATFGSITYSSSTALQVLNNNIPSSDQIVSETSSLSEPAIEVSPLRESTNKVSSLRELTSKVSPLRESVSKVSPLRESANKMSPLRGLGGGKTPQLNAWPNPTNGIVNIDLEGLTGNAVLLNIYNLKGQVVKSKNLGIVHEARQQIDLTTLEAGLYIISMESAGKRIQQKIVKH
ncbi:MAG: T9SS type A sorting domain-containing protein [Bacteroidota bacterium]